MFKKRVKSALCDPREIRCGGTKTAHPSRPLKASAENLKVGLHGIKIMVGEARRYEALIDRGAMRDGEPTIVAKRSLSTSSPLEPILTQFVHRSPSQGISIHQG